VTGLRLDVRGMRCPWPAIRLARAMRQAGAGTRIYLLADDPAAPREVTALAAEQGWEIINDEIDPDSGRSDIIIIQS
jgi:tRNA 2-thiouridine synthesizing protein A